MPHDDLRMKDSRNYEMNWQMSRENSMIWVSRFIEPTERRTMRRVSRETSSGSGGSRSIRKSTVAELRGGFCGGEEDRLGEHGGWNLCTDRWWNIGTHWNRWVERARSGLDEIPFTPVCSSLLLDLLGFDFDYWTTTVVNAACILYDAFFLLPFYSFLLLISLFFFTSSLIALAFWLVFSHIFFAPPTYSSFVCDLLTVMHTS